MESQITLYSLPPELWMCIVGHVYSLLRLSWPDDVYRVAFDYTCSNGNKPSSDIGFGQKHFSHIMEVSRTFYRCGVQWLYSLPYIFSSTSLVSFVQTIRTHPELHIHVRRVWITNYDPVSTDYSVVHDILRLCTTMDRIQLRYNGRIALSPPICTSFSSPSSIKHLDVTGDTSITSFLSSESPASLPALETLSLRGLSFRIVGGNFTLPLFRSLRKLEVERAGGFIGIPPGLPLRILSLIGNTVNPVALSTTLSAYHSSLIELHLIGRRETDCIASLRLERFTVLKSLIIGTTSHAYALLPLNEQPLMLPPALKTLTTITWDPDSCAAYKHKISESLHLAAPSTLCRVNVVCARADCSANESLRGFCDTRDIYLRSDQLIPASASTSQPHAEVVDLGEYLQMSLMRVYINLFLVEDEEQLSGCWLKT